MKKPKILKIILGSLLALALGCGEQGTDETQGNLSTNPNDTTSLQAPTEGNRELSAEEVEWLELQELLAVNLFNPPPQPLGPDEVPPINTLSLQGQDVSLSGLRGKVVALNFWATWCGPCRAEMPSMQIIQDRYQDQGFTFIAVNLQESQEEVMAFKNELAFDFPVWMDPTGVIAGEYGIQSIPTTYLINGKGEVVGRIIGSIDWTEAGVVQVIETLLSKLEA